MRLGHRITTTIAGTAALLLAATPVLAHECVNASKKYAASGAQIIFDGTFENIIWATEGVQRRLESGVIDQETGEGFHGIIGVDFEGDGIVDFATWTNVGPDGAIPLQAQLNGAECQGIVNVADYADCVT